MSPLVLAVREKSGSSHGGHSVGEETQVARSLSVFAVRDKNGNSYGDG